MDNTNISEPPQKEQTKQRYDYLDVLKVIAITFVMLYHIGLLKKSEIESSVFISLLKYIKPILSCCVPLFFMVSGALLLNKEVNNRKNIKRIIKLIILYFLWSFIMLICDVIIHKTNYSFKEFIVYWVTTKQEVSNYLWFLKDMAILYLALFALKPLFDKHRKVFIALYIVCFVVVIGVTTLTAYMNYPSIIRSFAFVKSIIYFMTGGLIHFYYNQIKAFFNNNKHAKLIVLPMLFVVMCACVYGLYSMNLSDVVWGGYYTIYTYFNVCCITLSCLIIINNPINKFFSFVGKNTFTIYVLHMIVITLVNLLLQCIGLLQIRTIINIGFILTYEICLLMALIVNKTKYLKWAFSI